VAQSALAVLLGGAVGCGSAAPLKPDGGSAGSDSAGHGGAGGVSGAGGSEDAGLDGQRKDTCATDEDCGSPELLGCVCSTQTCQCKPGDAGADQLACLPLFHDCTVDRDCCFPNRCLIINGPAQCQQEGPAPQSVTLRLVIPMNRSFCDRCGSGSLITILDDAGHAVETNIPFCSTTCSTCAPTLCPPIVCAAQAVPAENDFTWDGTSVTPATCGNNVACYQPGHAPAGHYVARMCATPGTITTADGGFPSTCTATGSIECVDVPFDFPGPSPVVGTLP
jgi:hypothetical protein